MSPFSRGKRLAKRLFAMLPPKVAARIRTAYRTVLQRALAKKQAALHARLLKQRKNNSVIRVVFLVSNLASWKLTPLYQAMQKDSRYEPHILVTPFLKYEREERLLEQRRLCDYFNSRGIAVTVANDSEGSCALDDLSPDVVFFTNPHSLTSPSLHEESYTRYLSVYIPYSHEVTNFDDNQMSYNQDFHNCMWKIFTPHKECSDLFKRYRTAGLRGVYCSGYPACEPFMNVSQREGIDREVTVWKKQSREMIRVIWAPHWSDTAMLPLATFYELAEDFRAIATKYRDVAQWAFKPHPLLRFELKKRNGWTQQKVDDYYGFWRDSEFTQLHEGDYEQLFLGSDALIHDCGSFLAEYLYLNKPALYLRHPKSSDGLYNKFGVRALRAHTEGRNASDVEDFLEGLLAGTDDMKASRAMFIRSALLASTESSPSDFIMDTLYEGYRNGTPFK